MTNQVSWGAYIAKLTFLVGVAAAAVMLVIPAYIYKKETCTRWCSSVSSWPSRSSSCACSSSTVDLGHPDRFHHMIPPFGIFNWPGSILSWDVIVLNGYLVLNLHIVGYLLYCRYQHRKPTKRFYIPFVFLSIVGRGKHPHCDGVPLRRPGGPQLLAPSACAGALSGLGVCRGTGPDDPHVPGHSPGDRYYIGDAPIFTLRMIMTVAMLITCSCSAANCSPSFYSPTQHAAAAHYLYFGLHGHNGLVPWIWTAVGLDALGTGAAGHAIEPTHRLAERRLHRLLRRVVDRDGMGLIIPASCPRRWDRSWNTCPRSTNRSCASASGRSGH